MIDVNMKNKLKVRSIIILILIILSFSRFKIWRKWNGNY